MRSYFSLPALALLVGPLSLIGCAGALGPVLIDGRPTPRLALEFTGQPYSIRHTDAYPKAVGPSSGVEAAGGAIAGTVCGADIQYQVTHNGEYVQISGFINNEYGVSLQIREANQIRRIQGALGNFAVDVLVADDIVAGSVGRCRYELHRDVENADQLSQSWRAAGFRVKMRVGGRSSLQELPAADQAALVPLILYCATAKLFENLGHDPPVLGFGGTMGSQPPHTINFGPQGGRSCGG